MGDPMKRNSEGLEMQKWNTPMDRAQKVDERNGFICLVFMFTLGDMMIKMPKMAHFFVFSADGSKKSVTNCSKYSSASGRFCLNLSENAIDYWILSYH